MEPRLKSRLWIEAHLRTCFANDMPAFVVARGDHDRGGILLKVNRFAAGVLVLEQSLDFDGQKIWRHVGTFTGSNEPKADEAIAKKRKFDPDLWVLEIEDNRSQYTPDAPISNT